MDSFYTKPGAKLTISWAEFWNLLKCTQLSTFSEFKIKAKDTEVAAIHENAWRLALGGKNLVLKKVASKKRSVDGITLKHLRVTTCDNKW